MVASRNKGTDMNNELYDFSMLPRRPHLQLPNGARMAFWVGVAVEHYFIDRPGMSITPGSASFVPDPLNAGWRDYGLRVGIWRMSDIFQQHGVPMTALLNSDVCKHYPDVIAEGVRRKWEWVAHGHNNNLIHQGVSVDEERKLLQEMHATIRGATGSDPKGWIGPYLSETFETPNLLAELGYNHILDWCADDQPFPMNVKTGKMVSVPYSIEINDATLFLGRNLAGRDFEDLIVDQFETLYAESANSARVMALGLHPFITGQPFRSKYLERAIARIKKHEGVWFTTSGAIADWYVAQLK
jgi:allantoinase